MHARRKDGSEFDVFIGIKEVPNSALLVGYIRAVVEAEPNESDKLKMSVPERHIEVDNTSFDSIIVIDPKGVILNVNLTALGEFGYGSQTELIGENINLLVGGGEANKHDMYLTRFDADGRDSSTIGNQRILYAKRKDGGEFPCVIGIRRSDDTDTLVGYIRNMTGISSQDRALKEQTNTWWMIRPSIPLSSRMKRARFLQ